MASASPSDSEPALARAAAIARAVRNHGGRALVVGGWVRDRLLTSTLPSPGESAPSAEAATDLDLEVFGVPGDELRRLLEGFGRVEAVGESFRVYKVNGLDVALPRRESKRGRGHRGFDVEGDPHMSLAEAARRRDFTINAISWDPLTGECVDPCNGRADLAGRLLRVVDPARFADDSLRVLRAVQFAARLDMTLDIETRAICQAIPLDDLPAERIWGEIEKLLFAPRPSIGLALARELGVMAKLFPELDALAGCPQEPEWHPEGDAWVHTLMVVDEARGRIDGLSRPEQIAMLLGAVCHDLGKPGTTALVDGRIRSIGHEEAGVAPTLVLLDRLRIHTLDGYDVRQQVVGLVQYHLTPGMWRKAPDGVGDGAFRRLAHKVDAELLARLAKADCMGRTGIFDCSAMDWFLDRARALGVEHRPPAPILMGRHLAQLGMAPGPAMGALLKQVYERQLDGGVTTLEEAMATAREIMSA